MSIKNPMEKLKALLVLGISWNLASNGVNMNVKKLMEKLKSNEVLGIS